RPKTRLLPPQFPPYRTLLPTEWASQAEVDVAPFVEAVKRVALLADRSTPVRLEFSDGNVALNAGGDDEGRAEEQLEVRFEGEPITIAFNASFLLDGLGVLDASTARLMFPSSNKPTVLRPAESDDEYYYLIMPM